MRNAISCRLSVLALLLLAAVGCGASLGGSASSFRAVVEELNAGQRWNRLDQASEHVAPVYRLTFMRARRAWGRDVRIADMELLELRILGAGERATSLVSLSWHDLRTTYLETTLVRQEWIRRDDEYVLSAEHVLEGSDRLFAERAEQATVNAHGRSSAL